MARFVNPGKRERLRWEQWVAAQATTVREVAEQVDPWTLYRLRSTGQRGTFCGLKIVEPSVVCVAVEVGPQFNPVLAGADRTVITQLEDLEPCPLPALGEIVGLFDVLPNVGGSVTLH